MPYEVKQGMGCPKDKPYAVVKKGTSEKLGCHPTPEAAGKQIGAITHAEKERDKAEWSERMRAVQIASRPDFDVTHLQFDDAELIVEVAQDTLSRIHGLRYVEAPKHDGMLFVYDEPVDVAFTMKDVEFDLDIWWFDKDFQLVGHATANAGDQQVDAPSLYQYVLEVPAGVLDIPDGSVLDLGA